jgi:DNA primase
MRIDIERLLLALGIDAKREGREWQARCPLPGHDDSKPSWSIRDQDGHDRHGRHHCFSCKQGGSAATLVRDRMGFDYASDAYEWMHENGITSDPDLPVDIETEARGTLIAEEHTIPMPKGVVVGMPLARWVSSARSYAERRGITDQQVGKWGIGYAIDGRCNGRIWLPIRDADGGLLSYTARAYNGSDIRYLTPRREEGPRTDAIFGCEHWNHVYKRIVVTEGSFNALACERAGARQIGALGGSSLTPTALAELSTFEEIDILTDPDAAGDSVALQLYYSLARWRRARRLRTPPKVDANDLPVDELRAILA